MLVRFKVRKGNGQQPCYKWWEVTKLIKLQKGIYLVKGNWFAYNFHHAINDFSWWQEKRGFIGFGECNSVNYKNGTFKKSYGFCDNVNQILDTYSELKDSKRKFIVVLYKVSKETHNFNWNEDGKYIGEEVCCKEWLSEEDGFNKPFYRFRIYEVEKREKNKRRTITE